jgi:hypothetical protein
MEQKDMSALWQGAALGAGLGAAAMWLWRADGCEATDTGAGEAPDPVQTRRAVAMLETYKDLPRDGPAACYCAEVAPLFGRLNPEAFRALLENLDTLARLMDTARTGTGLPVVIAQALRARRAAGGALADLVRDSRRRAPSQAAELLETFDSLHRHLDDAVHNIQQENSLRLWDARATGGRRA